MPVEVVPYSPSWPVQFELVAADLRQALSALPSARVEHVGSTSVPGLAAKPILDIDDIVDGEEMRKAVAAMVPFVRSIRLAWWSTGPRCGPTDDSSAPCWSVYAEDRLTGRLTPCGN